MRAEIASLIVARNEEEYLEPTLLSIENQTLPPKRIVLVDDGSTDDTAKIAQKHGCKIIHLAVHRESLIGTIELAERYNIGLRYIRDNGNAEYVSIHGGDHILTLDYFEKIIRRMKDDPKIVIASSSIKNQAYSETAPRGSGRIVNVEWWKHANGMQYPLAWGWESYIIWKALSQGYKTLCYGDIVTEELRIPPLTGRHWGEGMYALGYFWVHALARSFRTFTLSPKAGVEMLIGWLTHCNVEELDVAPYVRQFQRKHLLQSVINHLSNKK